MRKALTTALLVVAVMSLSACWTHGETKAPAAKSLPKPTPFGGNAPADPNDYPWLRRGAIVI